MNINKKFDSMEELKEYMNDRDYRCMYANLLVDYYGSLLEDNNIKKSRRYVLNAVNNHLVKKGLDKVSYQVVRTRIESKWN